VLQCVAVCRSVLQCVAVRWTLAWRREACTCVTGVCSPECVAVCCCELLCIAVCRSVLQCVAVCCSSLDIGVEKGGVGVYDLLMFA